MKSLKSFLECEIGCNAATPGNTLGMGNPGVINNTTLSEPIKTKNAKAKKEKPKKLQESILDDEEVLIGNATKDSKNPINLLRKYLKNRRGDNRLDDDFKAQADIRKIINKHIIPTLPEHLKNLNVRFYGENIALNISSYYSDFVADLIIFRSNIFSDVDTVQTNSNDELAIIFLDPFLPSDKKDLNKKYELTKDKYDKLIKKFVKEFNLNPSKKDKYIYSI